MVISGGIHGSSNGIAPNGIAPNGVEVPNGIAPNGYRYDAFILSGLSSNRVPGNGYRYNAVTTNDLSSNANGFLDGGELIVENITDLFFENETWNGIGYEISNVVINGTQNLTGLVPPASVLSGFTLDYIKYILSSVEVNETSTQILPYLVSCSLTPQDTFDFLINNETYQYTGFFWTRIYFI